MTQINLPTYEQSEDLKQQQSLIKQDTTNILSQFPISAGTDWGQYRHLSRAYTGKNIPTLTKVFAINSPGFIDYMNIKTTALGSTSTAIIRVKIDGVTIVDITLTAQNASVGPIYTSSFKYTKQLGAILTKYPEFPFVNTENNKNMSQEIVGATSIFFNKLEIEIQCPNTADNSCLIDISGGVEYA
ncbi:hypothetical protein [Lysinibacillus sp. 54212]|uniref:hypothetical protein n=1 Tax=Lysinibacillus sp. 54212 TaxID=3119829 RepID=UPI002FC64356